MGQSQVRGQDDVVLGRDQIAQEVQRVIEPVVSAAGLFLESIRVKGAGATQVVQVVLDLPETEIGSLSSDQLGEVSRGISKALDADDVVPGSYALEVSSPGATRTLSEPRHFKRARTRLVRLELHDGGEVTGRLLAITGDDDAATLELDIKGKTQTIPLAKVKKGKVELEMNRIDEADFDDDEYEADMDG